MSAHNNPRAAKEESPAISLTVLVGATLVAFLLNLLILGYAIQTTERAQHDAPAGGEGGAEHPGPDGPGAAGERRTNGEMTDGDSRSR